jgi:hypothetical protein
MTHMPPKKNKSSFWQKAFNKVHYGLIIHVIKRRIPRIGIDISPYYLYQENCKDSAIPAIKELDPDYSFGIILPEDLKQLENNGSGFSPEELLDFLKAGQKCFGVKYKGEVAAFMLVNFDELKYKSMHMQLKSNEAYLWNMFTLEPYRGRNLAPYLRFKSYKILNAMGRDTLYSVSECFNTPAIKFKRKLNAKIQKLMLHVRLFKKFKRNFTIKSYV